MNNAKFDALPAADFVAMMQDPLFLGDQNIDSQHLLGIAKWERVSDAEIVSQHQCRAAHVRRHEGQRTAAAKGHVHALVTMIYRKVEGEWKWAGIKTKLRWHEHDFENVFRGSAGKFQDQVAEGKESITA